MNRRKTRFVIWSLDKETLEISTEYKSARAENFLDFTKRLPDSNCRYAAYDHEFKTADGRITSKMYFFFWTPNNASQVNNVIYTQSLKTLRDKLIGVVNYNVAKAEDIKEYLGNEWIQGKGFTAPQEEEAKSDSESDFE
eukprot:CAMPEP_0205821438 /NCGR_PEP_ID=MMETSP0206-20130828/7497_1 /ASSEMBLY_ACC=CAM_ASM_000279 /TAXON_ID=36767 /ORGANISM="Euplotes focardii, Strain TN1" /LENGTH=138 /DNA_ID=CAMNT_0053116917 /DNA_START=63 /DNA_END=479 /DNA_ORIENTATION=+